MRRQNFAQRLESQNVRTDVYIDNVRLTSKSRSKVEEASKIFKQRCAEFGVTLNVEPGNEPHQDGDFLGLRYDYKTGCVQLGMKTLKKIKSATVPEREYLALFGLTLFYTRALRVLPARFFNQMKFVRKRCTGDDLDEEIPIWPSCVKGWET